jgi:hypothetical protein
MSCIAVHRSNVESFLQGSKGGCLTIDDRYFVLLVG